MISIEPPAPNCVAIVAADGDYWARIDLDRVFMGDERATWHVMGLLERKLEELRATRLCELPGDCPLGPEPHTFVPPEGTGPCCTKQPWEVTTT